jgi:hypothetical protein
LLPSVKLHDRHDQITRIGDLPRFKDLGDYPQRGILITELGSIIVWMRLEFRYSRLDRNVRETRSRENGKSPGSLIELSFKRFRVRSQRVKFVLRKKPDVWQHNFFGLRQLTHSRIHKVSQKYFPNRLATSPL